MIRINWRNKIDKLLKKYNRRSISTSSSDKYKCIYIEKSSGQGVYTRSGRNYKDIYMQLLEELCLNNKYS